MCGVQDMAVGIVAPNQPIQDACALRRLHAYNLHGNACADSVASSCHEAPSGAVPAPVPSAAQLDANGRGVGPSVGACSAEGWGDHTAACAPASGCSACGGGAFDADRVPVPLGRTQYSPAQLMALRAGCCALPLGIKVWPAQIMRTTCEPGAGQAPFSGPHSSRVGDARGFDAHRPPTAARGTNCARSCLLKDAARRWLGLPRELPGALPAPL